MKGRMGNRESGNLNPDAALALKTGQRRVREMLGGKEC